MAKVSLAKALRLKNQMVSRMSEIDALVCQHNVRVAGAPPGLDVKALMDEGAKLVKQLVALKAAIVAANQPV